MKNLMFILVLSPIFGMGWAQSSGIDQIVQALNSGNATTLGGYFDKNVEVEVAGNEDVYAKADAIKVVQDFFNKHKPKGFSQVHQGTSKGNDSQYSIGNLSTQTGTYRVYVYMKSVGGKYLIQELRFNKE